MTIGLDISALNDRQKTGVAVYTYNLIDALLKTNRKDKFILFGIATFDTSHYLKSLPFKNYPNVEMKIYRLPARLFRTTFLLWQQINWPLIETFTGSVDVFHSFNWYLPPQKTGKIVATVFDVTPILFPKFHQDRTVQLERIRLKRIAKFSDLVITISENSKKDFLRLYPEKWVEVVYPAISTNFVKKIDKLKSNQIIKKFDLRPDFLLSVGTLEPRKNLSALIEAYIKSHLRSQLVLVGGRGWKSEQIYALAKRSSQVKMLGFIDEEDLSVLYKQALCLVYPSFYEGFGLPVLEALSCGTPVITSDISSLREAGGDAVLYASPQDVDEIVYKLKLLVGSKKLQNQLVKKGFKQAKKYSWEKSAKKLMLLYQKLYLR